MHHIGHDMVEQPLIVGDDDHRSLWRAQPVDAIGDDFQRVDIEAGIGLVQHAEPRLQQRHLQDLIALLFAAGEPDIDRAAQHVRVDLKLAGHLANLLDEFGRGQFLLSAFLALRVERRAQERHGGDARDFHRILEREEQALGGAFVGLHFHHILAVEQDLSLGRLVTRLAVMT
jgi:hypothetical protein